MMKVYAIRDVKADSFAKPMVIVNEAMAKRGLSEAAAQPGSELSKYAEDYHLYELGAYDPNTGSLTGLPIPKFVCSVSGLLREVEAARNAAAVEAAGAVR